MTPEQQARLDLDDIDPSAPGLIGVLKRYEASPPEHISWFEAREWLISAVALALIDAKRVVELTALADEWDKIASECDGILGKSNDVTNARLAARSMMYRYCAAELRKYLIASGEKK